jgi:hypothetical protein
LTAPEAASPGLSWELYGVSGPLRHAAQRLYALPAQVVARGLYVLLLQGATRGAVYVFKRQDAEPRMATVAAATVGDLGGLPRMLVDALSKAPSDGAAEEVLSVLHGNCSLSSQAAGPTLAPVTPRAAFGLPLVELDEAGVVRACVLAI